MRTQLDDRHDLAGNTLYRFDFDATIAPGNNTRASALITIAVEEDDHPNATTSTRSSMPTGTNTSRGRSAMPFVNKPGRYFPAKGI